MSITSKFDGIVLCLLRLHIFFSTMSPAQLDFFILVSFLIHAAIFPSPLIHENLFYSSSCGRCSNLKFLYPPGWSHSLVPVSIHSFYALFHKDTSKLSCIIWICLPCDLHLFVCRFFTHDLDPSWLMSLFCCFKRLITNCKCLFPCKAINKEC